MNLFTYGVLMHPELLPALTGRELASETASLIGYRRHALVKDGYLRVPAIIPVTGASVEGMLVRGVDVETLAVLDEFEEVDRGLYVWERVSVLDHAGRTRRADIYVAGPEARGSWRMEDDSDFANIKNDPDHTETSSRRLAKINERAERFRS